MRAPWRALGSPGGRSSRRRRPPRRPRLHAAGGHARATPSSSSISRCGAIRRPSTRWSPTSSAPRGVRVITEVLPNASDALHQYFLTTLEGKVADFDVLVVDVVWVAELARAGWIADLSHAFPPETLRRELVPAAADVGRRVRADLRRSLVRRRRPPLPAHRSRPRAAAHVRGAGERHPRRAARAPRAARPRLARAPVRRAGLQRLRGDLGPRRRVLRRRPTRARHRTRRDAASPTCEASSSSVSRPRPSSPRGRRSRDGPSRADAPSSCATGPMPGPSCRSPARRCAEGSASRRFRARAAPAPSVLGGWQLAINEHSPPALRDRGRRPRRAPHLARGERHDGRALCTQSASCRRIRRRTPEGREPVHRLSPADRRRPRVPARRPPTTRC